MTTPEVVTVSAARAELTATLQRFRSSPSARPVVFGSHRRPEAVIVTYEEYRRGLHAPEGFVLDQLRARAELIRRLARANGVSDVRVYGSVARREETEASDIDLLVTPGDSTSTFDLAQFATDMELLLERSVDVASDRALDPVRDEAVLREAVRL